MKEKGCLGMATVIGLKTLIQRRKECFQDLTRQLNRIESSFATRSLYDCGDLGYCLIYFHRGLTWKCEWYYAQAYEPTREKL